MSTREQFIRRIEAFLKSHEMAPSRFGLLACNDPLFVSDLRGGRKPNVDLMDRVDRFMSSDTGDGCASSDKVSPGLTASPADG